MFIHLTRNVNLTLSPNDATFLYTCSFLVFSYYFIRFIFRGSSDVMHFFSHTLFTFFSLLISTNIVAVSYWISSFLPILICNYHTFYLISTCKILFSTISCVDIMGLMLKPRCNRRSEWGEGPLEQKTSDDSDNDHGDYGWVFRLERHCQS